MTPDNEQTDNLDATEALARLAADQPDLASRKLTFEEKCGAFAALYGGVHNSIVARAFGVTATTVSLLAGCLPYDPEPDSDASRMHFAKDKNGRLNRNKPLSGYARLSRNRSSSRKQHYQDVAQEFLELGPQAFNEKYYRPFHERLVATRRQPAVKKPIAIGPNMSADKYSWRNYKAFEIAGEFWRVSWLRNREDDTLSGWRFSPCQENGDKLEEGWNWQGDAENDDAPFRTSAEAFDGAYAFCGEESPRPKPGRPRR